MKKNIKHTKTVGSDFQRKKPFLLAVFVAAVVLLSHIPLLSSQALSFDDNQYLVDNQLVQNPSLASAGKFLTEVLRPSTVRGYYQPLTMISLMLDYKMGGRPDNLTVFHVVNVTMHTVNAVLLMLFIYLLFGNTWAAAVTGLLFGLHPITTEPIVWITERKTVLSTMFALGSLVFYMLYVKKSGRKNYYASFGLYLLALLAKPTSMPLPLLLLLLDYWPLARLSSRALLEKIPFMALAVISSVITFISQKNTAALLTPMQYSPMYIPYKICHNIVFYLGKILLPVNLSNYYPFPMPFDISNGTVLLSVIGTVLVAAALVLSLRWTRAFVTGFLFFFIAIFPAIGIIGFTTVVAADKYVYMPIIGLLVTLAYFLSAYFKKMEGMKFYITYRNTTAAVLSIILLLEIAGIQFYISNWRDSETLARYLVRYVPNTELLYFNLANTLSKQGKIDEAISEYNDIINMTANKSDKTGDRADAYNGIGTLYYNRGDYAKAISSYNEAIRLSPDNPTYYYNIGSVLAEQGKLDEALPYFTKASVYNKENTQYFYINSQASIKIGVIMYKRGKPDEAIDSFKKALQIQHNDAEAHKYLGVVYEELGNTDEAIREYREALRINPKMEDVQNSLNSLLKK